MNIDNNEYDFINSQEGIPARFELANAYCKMGDYKAARKIYKDIVNSGDQSQVSEANMLLEDLDKSFPENNWLTHHPNTV